MPTAISNLLRRPLFWMIAAEVLIVALLLATAWHYYQGSRHAHSSAAQVAPVPSGGDPVAVNPSPHASPAARPVAPPKPPMTPVIPGLSFDPATLNSDAAGWEQAEARMTLALTRAIRGYLEGVVLPAVERAERVSPAITPARTQSPAAIRNTP